MKRTLYLYWRPAPRHTRRQDLLGALLILTCAGIVSAITYGLSALLVWLTYGDFVP
jgi:hypothetical protein